MAYNRNQSNSSSCTWNFDVFVSFRGKDTRNSFIDHPFAALQRKGVVAFKDDKRIKKGELIAHKLLQAIERSRVFIVVFSKNYASSSWCMQELTKIVHWVEATGQSVLPVFYDVAPSEVRKQSGKFGKAFAKHEEMFKDDLEMVKKWREALKAIANRCGWDVKDKPQHEEIEKIVEEESMTPTQAVDKERKQAAMSSYAPRTFNTDHFVSYEHQQWFDENICGRNFVMEREFKLEQHLDRVEQRVQQVERSVHALLLQSQRRIEMTLQQITRRRDTEDTITGALPTGPMTLQKIMNMIDFSEKNEEPIRADQSPQASEQHLWPHSIASITRAAEPHAMDPIAKFCMQTFCT